MTIKTIRKQMLLTVVALSLTVTMQAVNEKYVVSSPNGKVKVTVSTDEGVRWSVDYNGTPVLTPSRIDIEMVQGKKTFGLGKVGKVRKSQVKSSFKNPFYKKHDISDCYGQMLIQTKQKFTIEVRAYDDGVAYRLISGDKKPMVVNNETAEFRFASDCQAFVPYVNDNRGDERYCCSFESYYDEVPLSKMYSDSLAITPLAVCLPQGMKAVVMDAGVMVSESRYIFDSGASS